MSLFTKEICGSSPECPMISYLTLLSDPCRPSITIAISSSSRCNLWSNPLNLNRRAHLTQVNANSKTTYFRMVTISPDIWHEGIKPVLYSTNSKLPVTPRLIRTIRQKEYYLYILPETSTSKVRCLGFVKLSPFSSGRPRLL